MKVLGLSEGSHVACMSPYSETLECAISLELILSATAGRATHRDTRTDTHTDTRPRSPRGRGRSRSRRWPPSVAGWLPPCGRAFLGVSTVPRYRHPPHTRRHRARPAPKVRGHSWPRAECSGRGGEAGSAATGSQVVGCGVTWGDARTHTHTHTRPQPHSSTHRHAIPCHSLRQSHRLAHSDSCITQIQSQSEKQINAQMRGHTGTLRYLQGDARMCSDTQTHSYTSSPPRACACPHTHTESSQASACTHTHAHTHTHTESSQACVCTYTHTHTQSPGIQVLP